MLNVLSRTRGLVSFNRWKQFTDFRLLGVLKSAASDIQRFLRTTAFAAFTKRHSALDFIGKPGPRAQVQLS
jgi:hypothetical protein